MKSVDFADSTFFISNDSKKDLKKVLILDAVDGDPESFPDDAILLLKNYKNNLVRGKPDPYKNHDVVALSTKRGTLMLPLQDLDKFATYLYSLAISLKEKV